MKRKDFTGVKTLTKLALRRDRFNFPAWLVGIGLMIASIAHAYKEFSSTEMAEMIVMASANPGMRLLVAPIAGESLGEPGPFFLFRTTFIVAVLVALMSSQMVVRHTRHNEETGCAELLGSSVLGRYAALTASLIVNVAANIMMSAVIALALMANCLPAAGSFVAGASFGAIGIVFGGIAAVTAQLSGSARGASGLAAVVLAGAFLINSLGNVMGSVFEGGRGFESAWLVWLSPLGWGQQMYAFGQNNVWILAIFAALFVALIYGAFVLVNRRDVGSGILPARKGPASAPAWMLNPLGLAWRLQRGSLLGWAVPMAVFGLIFGAASQEYGDTIQDIEIFQRVSHAAGQFLFMVIGVVAATISIYTMQSLMRMRSEEAGGPLESILATAASRVKWMAGHVACAVFGTAVLLVLYALVTGLASGSSGGETADLVMASLYQGAAVLSLAGFVIAAYGLFPRQAGALSWAAVMTALLAGPFFGVMLNLPQAVLDISPFSHVAVMPTDVSLSSIVILLVAGSAMAATGMVSFTRRNLSL